MQIGPFENELYISSAPVKLTLLTSRSLERYLLNLFVNDVRRMNNGAFRAMTDRKEK
ncbi:hypothetical protein T03_14977 [Trichinella britovi]|uniref:Uncharacterized protein n=1 Tax=Trichinella britovi TaxID=45882 RepID=A0A0V1ANR4_TRIBR|nr:hypothetical protein T03_14977 [Trichinella britovi]